jgi:hypothetical protein
MFFSPLVNNILNKKNIEITNDDEKFIKWYIKLWYLLIIILSITLLTWLLNYNIQSEIIDILYNFSIISLTIILVAGSIGILTDTNILIWDKQVMDLYYEHITSDKKEVLLNYIPIYNIYLWYTQHNFNEPNILIKTTLSATCK